MQSEGKSGNAGAGFGGKHIGSPCGEVNLIGGAGLRDLICQQGIKDWSKDKAFLKFRVLMSMSGKKQIQALQKINKPHARTQDRSVNHPTIKYANIFRKFCCPIFPQCFSCLFFDEYDLEKIKVLRFHVLTACRFKNCSIS